TRREKLVKRRLRLAARTMTWTGWPAVTTGGAIRRSEICLRLVVARIADRIQKAHVIEKMRNRSWVEVLMAASPIARVTATKIQPSMGTTKLLCDRGSAVHLRQILLASPPLLPDRAAMGAGSYTSRFWTSGAWRWIKARRGTTSSPISVLNMV